MGDKIGLNGGHKWAEWRTAIVPPSVYSHLCISIFALEARSVASDKGAPEGNPDRIPRARGP